MSTAHISDELPLLLSGEASHDAVMAAADHLRSCPDCQQDLVSAVVAHASLTSAQRFAPEIVASGVEQPRHAREADEDPMQVESLPDLSGIFARVRGEAQVEAARPSRRRNALLAVAAAAVVATGTVAVVESTAGSGTAPAAQRVVLKSYQPGPDSLATLIGANRLKIDATSLPKLAGGKQYEVWLTKTSAASGDEPQSVGFINSNRKADLSIPANVISQYNTVSVSVQEPNQIKYSGDLVVYGRYRD